MQPLNTTAAPPNLHTALTQWAQWLQAGDGPHHFADVNKMVVANTSTDPLATRIEHIVQHMESNGRWKEARVLRADRLLADLPEPQRLHRLARIGLRLRHSTYYAYLRSALAYVEGALSVFASQK